MLLKTQFQKTVGLYLCLVLLLFLICASIVYGYTDTSWKVALEAFTDFNGSKEHLILQSVRLPRSLIAACIGASLAISGVLMQTLTKNPLASPEIFGINAGAGLAVVISVTIFSAGSTQAYTWVSFLGAAIAAIGVYIVGSFGREGLTPLKLTLAGSVVAVLFSSITQGFLVISETTLDQVLFWLAGSVQGRKLDTLTAVLPYLAVGWVISLLLASKLNLLSMGDDVAKGLGLKVGFIKLTAASCVILLAGGAVAIAGPVGFIGIVIPHITRAIIGIDHRWIIPYSAMLGGILLLAADILARYVIMPQEVPVGVMTAIIGTPFFIHIARKGFNAN
ncbi:iron ABC transporter permease [Peribacillus cavernae]|uniref:Iron ABC transporter permease n=1 Tax=Peribacillus cavernae TaxID=1674310 RepID=A0A3S0TRT1_9BACI|nr:iron ABC transporter permease [Peribacillus cavernae]RUQ26008.1 iron ABC transporter permease [Peribacillus cavernae]